MANVAAFVSTDSGASATSLAVRRVVLGVGMAQTHDVHEQKAQKWVAVVALRREAATVVLGKMSRQTEEVRVMRTKNRVRQRQCCLCLGDEYGCVDETADRAKARRRIAESVALRKVRMRVEAGSAADAYRTCGLPMGSLHSELPPVVSSLRMLVFVRWRWTNHHRRH